MGTMGITYENCGFLQVKRDGMHGMCLWGGGGGAWTFG
jgi:hypothetical protein